MDCPSVCYMAMGLYVCYERVHIIYGHYNNTIIYIHSYYDPKHQLALPGSLKKQHLWTFDIVLKLHDLAIWQHLNSKQLQLNFNFNSNFEFPAKQFTGLREWTFLITNQHCIIQKKMWGSTSLLG